MAALYTLYQIFYAAFPLNKFMQTQNASSCLHANMEIRLVVSRMENIFGEISSVIKISWRVLRDFPDFLHGQALLPYRYNCIAIKRSREGLNIEKYIMYYNILYIFDLLFLLKFSVQILIRFKYIYRSRDYFEHLYENPIKIDKSLCIAQ